MEASGSVSVESMKPVEPVMYFPCTREEVAAQCRKFGAEVQPLPQGIAGYQLLWALSGVESSFGSNVKPRHEPAYDVGGEYAGNAPCPELLAKYGRAAACSYGPWQVLLVNAPDFTPAELAEPGNAAQASVTYLNSLLRRFKPQTLAEIGSCWNAGHIQKPLSVGVARYANDLTKFYAEPMPEP